MLFQKEDMECEHYNWDTGDNKEIFLGEPSRRLFDRVNGNQVLFIINSFGPLSDKFTIEDGRTIEYEIFNRLPLDAKSEISVYNWIQEVVFTEK